MNLSLEEAIEEGKVIALADSQMLRSIREIIKHTVDLDKVERMHQEKHLISRRLEKPHAPKKELNERLDYLQAKLRKTMYIPAYVTVVIEHDSHYEYMFKHGFYLDGHKFVRLSCSAGQARVSTVVFCWEEILDELEKRINNGRNEGMKLAPSKFNAYFGLASSATKLVSEPRIAVVKDFENTTSFMAHYIIETAWDKDDVVEDRMIEDMPMKRTDGMGLISPELSKRWADDIGIDYIPSQWIVRQSFLKGMVCTFDFHKFCEEKNGGNFIIDTVYKDKDGNPVKADLRNVDLIVSESQFKLWDSFSSVEEYMKNCRKNHLKWGVSQYSPKEVKNTLMMNYQFLQTLDMNEEDVKELCEQFVDWIKGVSVDDYNYMLLFLMGVSNSEEDIIKFLKGGNNSYWIRCLLANKEAINDKYILQKVRELIHGRIQAGCMGKIILDGNFQTMVSDPYAYMEHVCGLPVKGLLGKGEYFSNYWNEKGVKRVDACRSPLTYRSEHVILDFKLDEETAKWYQWCKSGIIYNWHGHEVVCHAGADFDGDIVATTSNPVVIRSVYRNALPVVYDPPSPEKIHFNKRDLFNSDLFGFGSIIGSITNKSSDMYAMLPVLEEKYGKDSEEVKLIESRLKQCCAAQSRQIDQLVTLRGNSY